jgi:hypothetical protein
MGRWMDTPDGIVCLPHMDVAVLTRPPIAPNPRNVIRVVGLEREAVEELCRSDRTPQTPETR